MRTMTVKAPVKRKNKAVVDIICDIDGCLVDTSWIWKLISPFDMPDNQKLTFFNLNANSNYSAVDKTLLSILDFCRKMNLAQRIIFLTARSEVIAAPTINFLQQKTALVLGKDFLISFRPAEDNSNAAESKKTRLLKLLSKGHKIIFAIDDNAAVCKMYCENNVNCYQWQIGTVPVDLLMRLGGDLGRILRGENVCLN